MEFWGVEVKPGAPLTVTPDHECLIHISQVALGESKKGTKESVCLYLKRNEEKLVLGHLSTNKIPQLYFDLIIDTEVELSHNSANSVFFIGYQSAPELADSDASDSSSDEDVPVQLANAENGVKLVQDTIPAAALAPKPVKAMPESSSKPKSKPVQPVNDSDESDDSFDVSDEDDDDESGDSDEEEAEGMSVDGDDSEEEDDSESEEEETPKKAGKDGNKRAKDSAIKTPVPSKKQKAAATPPQKTDGKKSVHTATPHPAKAKTKANGTDSKQKTPKSGSKFTCSSCEKPFGSETALQSHSKAKHSAK